MTDRELRKLTRKDLLELLVSQGREQEELRAELEKAKAALQERQLQIQEAGSVAEAALRLNGVFEAAQAAAQQYLENIRQRSEQTEEVFARREEACIRQEEEMKEKMSLLGEAVETAGKMEEILNRKCQAEENQQPETAATDWPELLKQLQLFRQRYEALKRFQESGGVE